MLFLYAQNIVMLDTLRSKAETGAEIDRCRILQFLLRYLHECLRILSNAGKDIMSGYDCQLSVQSYPVAWRRSVCVSKA